MTQMVLNISSNWGPTSSGGSMGASADVNNLKQQLVQYRQLLTELRNMRKISEKLFMNLATDAFKKLKGKNYINIFYQKEFRITPDRETMEALRANRNIRFDAIELFDEDRGDEFIDIEKVSQALKASSVTVNFFYIQKQAIRRTGLQSKEFSYDVYNVLSKIAKATGGVVIPTSKLDAALEETFGGK